MLCSMLGRGTKFDAVPLEPGFVVESMRSGAAGKFVRAPQTGLGIFTVLAGASEPGIPRRGAGDVDRVDEEADDSGASAGWD